MCTSVILLASLWGVQKRVELISGVRLGSMYRRVHGTTKFEHRVSNRPYVRTAVRKGGKLLDENVQENELESVRICSIVMMDISLSSYLRIGYG